MNRWVVVVMSALMPMVAMAAKDTTVCSNKNVKEIQVVLATVDKFLPQVPPEERQFLETEKDSIMSRFYAEGGFKDSNLKERYSSLTHRRLYYVLEFRKEVTKLRKRVDDLLLPTDGTLTSDAIARAYRGAYMFSPVYAYTRALDELLKEEELQPKPFVTSGNFEVTLSAFKITNSLEAFLDCNLAPIALKPGSQ